MIAQLLLDLMLEVLHNSHDLVDKILSGAFDGGYLKDSMSLRL